MLDWDRLYLQLKDVTVLSTFVRLLLAMVLGGTIGIERGWNHRAAGLRTHILVCIGAALSMITGQYIVQQYGLGDPARMGAQVISGIGFLGIGTIVIDRHSQMVRGLTTAAGLWASACVGLAVGIGFYSGAVLAWLFIAITVIFLNKAEHHLFYRARKMELYVEFTHREMLDSFVSMTAQLCIVILQMDLIPPRYEEKGQDHVAALLQLQLPSQGERDKILRELKTAQGLVKMQKL